MYCTYSHHILYVENLERFLKVILDKYSTRAVIHPSLFGPLQEVDDSCEHLVYVNYIGIAIEWYGYPFCISQFLLKIIEKTWQLFS